MNSRAQGVARLSNDLVQRLRIFLSSSGDDANVIVDRLTRELGADIAAHVCETLGIEYEGPPDVPRRNDGRPAPWARKGGAKSGKGS